MKLTLALTDQRIKAARYDYTTSNPDKEDFDRVTVTALEGNGAVIAAALRGIADDIDPPADKRNTFADGGVLR